MHPRSESILPLACSALIAGVLTFMGLPVAMVLLAEHPQTRQRSTHDLAQAMLQPHSPALPPQPTSLKKLRETPPSPTTPKPSTRQPTPPPPKPEQPPIRVGKDDGDPIATVSWISYQDFQELIAPQARTNQPALQQQVDPVAQAPYRIDPTQGPTHVTPQPPTPPSTKSIPAPAVAPSPRTPALNPTPAPPPPPAASPKPILASDNPSHQPLQQSPNPTATAIQPNPSLAGSSDRTIPAQPAIPPSPALNALAIHSPNLQPGQMLTSIAPGTSTSPPQPEQKLIEPQQATTAGNQLPASPGNPEAPSAPAPDQPSTATPNSNPSTTNNQPTADPTAHTSTQPSQPAPTPAPPAAQPAAQPGQNQNHQATGDANQPAKPTAAPRSDRESPPVSIKGGTIRITPGTVLTGKGLEIKTVMPRINVVARFVIPSNPTAKIVFDSSGQVIEAKLLKSTGYENWDGPILASLYKWRASGQMLQQINDRFELEITLVFIPD